MWIAFRRKALVGVIWLFGGCAEPFGMSIVSDAATADDGFASTAASGDLRAVAADLGVEPDVSVRAAVSAAKPSKVDETEEEESVMVESEDHGDVLAIGEDGTPSSLRGVTVRLICSGSEKEDEDGKDVSCYSTLSVLNRVGKKKLVIAETDAVPGQKNIQTDGSSTKTTIVLDLIPLLKNSHASLIRVRESTEKGESITDSSLVTEHLFVVHGRALVEVMMYKLESSSNVDSGSPKDHSEHTTAELTIEKTMTRGLPNLLVSEVHRDLHGASHKLTTTKTKTSYVWVGDRYDACAPKLDTVTHCGRCGNACAAGQGCCDKSCAVLDTAQHCGTCATACPSPGPGAEPHCADPKQQRCDIICLGDFYDVDGDPQNGCERRLSPAGHHRAEEALDRGQRDCSDGGSADELTGELNSDARIHDKPALAGLSLRTGAAPTYIRVQATGGLLCQNDIRATLQLHRDKERSPPSCYRLTVGTDRGQRSVDVTGVAPATIASGRGAYSAGTAIVFKIEKICPLPIQESVRYTLRYHL